MKKNRLKTNKKKKDTELATSPNGIISETEDNLIYSKIVNRIKAVAIEEIDMEEYQFPPVSSLSASDKTLLENIKPIKILADRIANHNLKIEHKKEEIYELSLIHI